MGSPEDLVSHHVTVLRRCGLSDEDICEVYGVADPPDDVSVGRVVMASFDGEPTPRNLYDQTHRVLATAPRGIDAPRDYPNRVVPKQLNTVMGAYGFSMYFLDGNGEPLSAGDEPSQPFRIALEDPNGNVRTTSFEYPDTRLGEGNYPALVAAIQSDLLDGVPLTFAMLSDWADDRWRFVLFEADRLDALESHYGDGIECFGEPLLHEQSPAEFAASLATEPPVEATAGSGSSDSSGDGDISVDESTEGWLGSGGSDLSDVDLESSSADESADESAEEAEVETGLEDIFSTIEEDATAGGDGGVEIESAGKSVDDLVAGGAEERVAEEPTAEESTAEEPTAEEPAAEEPAETESVEAESEPAAETASASSPEPADAEPAGEPESPATAEPEPTPDPAATADSATEADATPSPDATADADATAAADTADAESVSIDTDDGDSGFVTAEPEPARTSVDESEMAETVEDDATAPASEAEAEPETTGADEVATADADEAVSAGESGEGVDAGEPTEAEEPTAGDTEAAQAATSDTPTEETADAEPAGEPAPTEAAAPTADKAESAPAEEPSSPGQPAGADGDTAAVETADGPATEPPQMADSTDDRSVTIATTDEPESTEPEPTEPESTEPADATATADPEQTDGESDDDSPGFFGRIVGAIKGIF